MLAVADVDERADDVAHHVLQEGVRAYHDLDLIAGALYGDGVDGAHRRLRLAFCRSKGRKIVLAEQRARTFAHRLRIERRVIPAGVTRRERRAYRPIDQPVPVRAGKRAVAGVELRRDPMRP